MHPILFRIPLPHWPIRLWWVLVGLSVLTAVYAGLARRRGEQNAALGGVVVTAALIGFAYLFRGTMLQAGNLPIFSYGVMLGLSLIVGWFLTLRIAPAAGFSKDVVANGFLVAALVALAGARLQYVLTNFDKFDSAASMLNLRSGGYSLYGGFLGGVLGSYLYIARSQNESVLRWGDLVAPSLTIGLFLTRIGCWLFGCDFGSRLSEGAPGWLKRAGTFPHWTGATQDAGEGSEPYLRQRLLYRGTPDGMELSHREVSFPVHPTQIYEALLALALLGLVLWMRKRKPVQGRVFTALVFAYGLGRYLIEFVRDDPDHIPAGPAFPFHVMLACGLGLFALGYALGIARIVADPKLRLYSRIAAFLPAVAAFFVYRPAAFAASTDMALSVNQWLALSTALVAAYVFGNPPQAASPDLLLVPVSPRKAQSVAPPAPPPEDQDDDDEDEEPVAPVPVPT